MFMPVKVLVNNAIEKECGMIACRDDYLRYLESDRVALGRKRRYGFIDWMFDPIWTYQRVMRYLAYLINVKCATIRGGGGAGSFLEGLCGLITSIWGRSLVSRLESIALMRGWRFGIGGVLS